MILSAFFPYTSDWGKFAGQFFNILAAFAFVLGGGNLLKLHLKKISDQRPGWAYSGVVLVCFIVTLFRRSDEDRCLSQSDLPQRSLQW